MLSIITGDIIESQTRHPDTWMEKLKAELNTIGQAPAIWEIYRGDSFQVLINDPFQSLLCAFKLKATIKSIKGLDVRMAIGFGNKDYSPAHITESNGTAFVFSGEKYERLKKENINLAIRSSNEVFDAEINLYLKLLLSVVDKWTVNSAEIVKICLEHPTTSQEEIGKILGIKQNAVSNRLKRACFEELNEVLAMFKTKLKRTDLK